MAISIQPELVTAIAGIGGAVFGYAFREYRNRVRPFFHVTDITGDISKRTDKIDVDPKIAKAFDDTFYIKPLSKKCRYGEFYDTWDRTDDIKQIWPHLRPNIDAIIEATSESELTIALNEVFKSRYFEQWLLLLLAKNRITFQDISTTPQDVKIPMYDSEENNGTIWCDFGFDARTFGRGMSHPAIRAKADPWLKSVQYLHHPSIASAMEQYKSILESEYNCALQHIDKMLQKVNEHSRWCLTCYLANLNNTPLVIENECTLTITDRTIVRYSQPCYLTLLKYKKDGSSSYVDTLNPIVIKPSTDTEFAVMTKDIQGDMDLGNAVREAFDRGEGKCHVSLWIRKVGLIRRQRYNSPSTNFMATEKAK